MYLHKDKDLFEVSMYEILDELIECLISFYGEINSTWRNSGGFMSVNLRKKTVADIEDNLDIWNMIRSYREFMSCQQASILRSISCLQSEANRVSSMQIFRMKIWWYILEVNFLI